MINTSEQQDSEKYKDSILSDSAVDNPATVLNVKDTKENRFDGLTKMDFWAYGMGHFINDMTATCWFNYMLFFLSEVVHTGAGPYAILVGQIADGIATPIVGILSDRTKTRIGQRKPWYIAGFILIVCAFLPSFQDFSKYSDNKTMETAYYMIFPSLFNIGWAALQISHMSLVPALSCSRKRRDKLNNLRNSFTFVANLTVLTLGLIIFSVMSNRSLEINLISYIVVIFGSITSIFFIWRINQVKLTLLCQEKTESLREQLTQASIPSDKSSSGTGNETQYSEDVNMNIHASIKKGVKVDRWYDWFKMPSFYVFGICYMGVRLYCNLFGTLLPFYLVYVLNLGSEEADKIPFTMALVQLLVYLASVATSLFLSKIYEKFGRKNTLLLGGILCIIAALCMIFLNKNLAWPIYIIALMVGVAQSMTLSTGVNLISEVIGTKSKKGAIVFGIYSLLDKFSSGIIIFAISSSAAFASKSPRFIKLMTIIVPSAACLISCILVYFNPIQQYKNNSKMESLIKKRRNSIEQELVL